MCACVCVCVCECVFACAFGATFEGITLCTDIHVGAEIHCELLAVPSVTVSNASLIITMSIYPSMSQHMCVCVCVYVYSPQPSSRGNIFRNDDKENSLNFDNGRSRASQRPHLSSLSFNVNPQGLQGRSLGGKGVREGDPHVGSPGGQKEKERSDKSRDAAAQW